MTHSQLKLLLIEDSEDDAFFLIRQLEKGGYELDFKRIETESEMRSALLSESWDLIITDHTLPDFSSIEAINVLNDLNQTMPLIVLSGTIDQSIAVESMRLGARDFIMKDDTTRLIPAIERELQDARVLREARESALKHKSDMQGMMEHSADFIFIKDLQGNYTFINKKGEQLLNMEREEVIGKCDSDLYSKEEADKLLVNDKRVIETGLVVESEDKLKLGNNHYIFSSIKYPLFDGMGVIYAVCGISTDITVKKQQQEKLRRSQKMEAIGQLSGGVAHDFNNHLGVIVGYLELVRDFFSMDEKAQQMIEKANQAAYHCVDLTRQLLLFSRRSSSEKTIISMNDSLREFTDLIKRSITPQIEVEFVLQDDLWNIEVDASEFQDVMLNLVINARDAMPGGGKLIIETRNTIAGVDDMLSESLTKPGEYAQLLIRDTGAGMDKATIEHIFEPFFTTKPVGKGTGLGLSMIYGFVSRFKGDISVDSEPGSGSVFCLSFPRINTRATVSTKENNQIEIPRGFESILIVDDEAELLNIADLYLTDLGYKTYRAENAAQALEILSNNKSIDLLFTDIVMPGGVNGYQLAESALKMLPDLKLLMTSGFTAKTMQFDGLDRSNCQMLKKPYNKISLATNVRISLDK